MTKIDWHEVELLWSEGLKRCTKCWEVKVLGEFRKHTDYLDGRFSLCKACEKAYKKTRNFSASTEGVKTCTACGQSKAVVEFSEFKYNPDGRLSVCKECVRVYNKTRNFPAQMEGYKACSVCGKTKHITEFRKFKQSPDGRCARCAACQDLDNTLWRKANPNKAAAKRQRRRARKKSLPADFTDEHEQIMLQLFDNTCPYCGADLLEAGYHMDHFIPLVLGGGSTIGNMVPACPHCNTSKGGKHPDKFLGPDLYQDMVTILETVPQLVEYA